MKIALRQPHTNSGCDYYRIALWAHYAVEDDDIMIMHYSPDNPFIFPDVDVLVLSRPSNMVAYNFAKEAKKHGVKIVVEFDDDVHAVREDNVHRPDADILNAFDKCVDIADHIIVSSDNLFDQYSWKPCTVIPNYIDKGIISLGRRSSTTGKRIGWAAGLGSHPNDLQEFAPEWHLLHKDGYQFHHVGDGNASSILRTPTVEYGLLDLQQYILTIHDKFDIGIIPLEASIFNDSKSYIKGLEYAACGVPWVSSPAREYYKLYDEGVIKSFDFTGEIKKLQNELYYQQRKSKLLKWAERNTMDVNYDRWLDVLKQVNLDKSN